MGPGLILAAVIIVVATQATRVVRPRRGSLARDAAVSVAGLLVGELIAATGHLASPPVGALHPFGDVLAIAVLQVASLALAATSATA